MSYTVVFVFLSPVDTRESRDILFWSMVKRTKRKLKVYGCGHLDVDITNDWFSVVFIAIRKLIPPFVNIP